METKPLKTTVEFKRRFSSEKKREEFLSGLRWGHGLAREFVCPACLTNQTWKKVRGLQYCAACGRQTSATAGTLLHGTKVPLRKWLLAVWLYVGKEAGIGASDLMRKLKLGSYRTAWSMEQKLRKAVACCRKFPDWISESKLKELRKAVAIRGAGWKPMMATLTVLASDEDELCAQVSLDGPLWSRGGKDFLLIYAPEQEWKMVGGQRELMETIGRLGATRWFWNVEKEEWERTRRTLERMVGLWFAVEAAVKETPVRSNRARHRRILQERLDDIAFMFNLDRWGRFRAVCQKLLVEKEGWATKKEPTPQTVESGPTTDPNS